MKYSIWFISLFLFMPIIMQAQHATLRFNLQWGELSSIPDPHGFAGSFAGVSHDALIVAGGANFPDGGAPWTGSQKVWSNKIFVLDKPTGSWKMAGELPQPMGYGASIIYNNKLICVGGSNAGGHLATVYAISYVHGKTIIERWPDLPGALANSCAALIGQTIYLAGGLFAPNDKNTAHIFWSFNLQDAKNATWQKLKPWPGAPRMLSVAGSNNKNTFYLFGGTDLENKDGTAHRKYLKDAYKYTVGQGWKKLTDMPFCLAGAPSAILSTNGNELLIFGGDNGQLADDAAKLKEKHPGFSDHVLQYDIAAGSWTDYLKVKTAKRADSATNPNNSIWAPVTTTVVIWKDKLVFPGGEVRPAVRTPRVLTVTIKQER